MKRAKVKISYSYILAFGFCLAPLLLTLTGCSGTPKAEAEAQSRGSGAQRGAERGPTSIAVDVAIARPGVLQEAPIYIGTTRPAREVSLRSQVEGRLLNLNVNVGDRVQRGQQLAQLDSTLLLNQVTQAEAELATRDSEVARARTQVSNARARAEQAKVTLKQAQSTAARRAFLQKQGAISLQDAELAQTEVGTNKQAVLAAEEQIRTEQQAVAAAQGRVVAQRAVIAELKERLSYAKLISPVDGVVIERTSEPGNLVQPGGEVLKLGEFNQVKVIVPLSELELPNIQVGQSVQVQLDAFPNQNFAGTVARISPAADPTARQIPVEILIPNQNGQIGSGLLARVQFTQQNAPKVLIPTTALEVSRGRGRGAGEQGSRGAGEQGSRGAGEQGSRGAGEQGSRGAGENNSFSPPIPPSPYLPSPQSPVPSPQSSNQGTIFVVTAEGREGKVAARQVVLGDRANSKVEVISGLQAGERFVVRSGRPIKDGDAVRFSILSEGVGRGGGGRERQSSAPTQEENTQQKGRQ
ncbi:efflux RND transporter periplasmic adaptor subunit [Aerosakkonemataceae cyanobacterium BLCC-F50]|uniref:Efflux RND transporter periplasmic adaptor subunit n=1 Tax=Floridaenema flaviceps BLCC-F50 TaxID=3153642 RepID=A0ABV4Y5B8_9CYAN